MQMNTTSGGISNDRNRLHVTTGHTKDLSGSGSGLILLSHAFF